MSMFIQVCFLIGISSINFFGTLGMKVKLYQDYENLSGLSRDLVGSIYYSLSFLPNTKTKVLNLFYKSLLLMLFEPFIWKVEYLTPTNKVVKEAFKYYISTFGGGGRGDDQKCLYCVCNISISGGGRIWKNLLVQYFNNSIIAHH